MIRQTVRLDLHARLRSPGTALAVLLLVLAFTLAVALAFRAFGQDPAPMVSYGVGGFGQGFGRLPITSSDLAAEQRQATGVLTASGRGVAVLVVLGGLLAVSGAVLGAAAGAGAVAGEAERETLDLLLTTQLGLRGLIVAKLLSTALYVALLALAVLPAFGLLLVFDAPPLPVVLATAAIVLASTLCGSAIGVFFSAWTRSSVAAFLGALGLCLLLCLGGGAAYLVLERSGGEPGIAAQLLLLPNPVAALLSSSAAELQGPATLLWPALLRASPAHPVHLAGPWQLPLPLWTLTLALDALLTLVLAAAATRALGAQARRWR